MLFQTFQRNVLHHMWFMGQSPGHNSVTVTWGPVNTRRVPKTYAVPEPNSTVAVTCINRSSVLNVCVGRYMVQFTLEQVVKAQRGAYRCSFTSTLTSASEALTPGNILVKTVMGTYTCLFIYVYIYIYLFSIFISVVSFLMKCIRYSKIISSTKKKSYMNVIYMQFQHLWKNSSRSLNVPCVSQTNKQSSVRMRSIGQ